jgi:hypothetical protein
MPLAESLEEVVDERAVAMKEAHRAFLHPAVVLSITKSFLFNA